MLDVDRRTAVSSTLRTIADSDSIATRETASFRVDIPDVECTICAVGASGHDF